MASKKPAMIFEESVLKCQYCCSLVTESVCGKGRVVSSPSPNYTFTQLFISFPMQVLVAEKELNKCKAVLIDENEKQKAPEQSH